MNLIRVGALQINLDLLALVIEQPDGGLVLQVGAGQINVGLADRSAVLELIRQAAERKPTFPRPFLAPPVDSQS